MMGGLEKYFLLVFLYIKETVRALEAGTLEEGNTMKVPIALKKGSSVRPPIQVT